MLTTKSKRQTGRNQNEGERDSLIRSGNYEVCSWFTANHDPVRHTVYFKMIVGRKQLGTKMNNKVGGFDHGAEDDSVLLLSKTYSNIE